MQAGTERVWMKSVMLERDQGNMEAACELLSQALEKYPTFAKLWMILIQVGPPLPYLLLFTAVLLSPSLLHLSSQIEH